VTKTLYTETVWKNREECRGFLLGIHIVDKIQTDNDVEKLSFMAIQN